MTRKPPFTEAEKDFIVACITSKQNTVTELANYYKRHPKSINRVMDERGISTKRGLASIKAVISAAETKRIKKLLADAQINGDQLAQLLMILMASNATDPERLKTLFAQPALTPANVQVYLNACTQQQLATHFYGSALTKLVEIAKAAEARKNSTAALFKPDTQVEAANQEKYEVAHHPV